MYILLKNLLAMNVDTFFHNIGAVMFGAVSLTSRKLVTLMKLSSAFCLPALLSVLCCSVSRCPPDDTIMLSTE